MEILDQLLFAVDYLTQLLHRRVFLVVAGDRHRLHHLDLPLELLLVLAALQFFLAVELVAELGLLALVVNNFTGGLGGAAVAPMILVDLHGDGSHLLSDLVDLSKPHLHHVYFAFHFCCLLTAVT